MPKIEVKESLLTRFLGKKLTEEQLEKIAVSAKAEIDEINREEGIIKIELNDTNRPDLWSTPGLARHFAIYGENKKFKYDFFSTEKENKDSQSRKIVVENNVRDVRPYIAAFQADGDEVDEDLLKDLIQSQEKLCWNFGRKRSSIAMGIYRADLIKFPVHYSAVSPDTKFVPLGYEEEMSLKKIIEEHPKGKEFGWILKNLQNYPFLTDSAGNVLSFPPIINSAYLGAVKVGDKSLFVELTGTDLKSLLLAASIAACDLKDAGFKIKPVKVIYPYETEYGKEITTPYYFQKKTELEIEYANKLIGEDIPIEEAKKLIERMGNKVERRDNKLILTPPPYRNDFMHPVDVMEEIVISRGMETFEPILPEDFTVGRLSPIEELNRAVRDIMVGLGYQEMIYNYLGSKKDFVEKMNIRGDDVIEIANPMTENFEIVRNSIIPNLLNSESVSGNALYPHKIFELGKIVVKDRDENYGTKTKDYLSMLIADREAGFNEINSHISAVMFYLSKEYNLEETSHPSFIEGRCASVVVNGEKIGIVGEIHPQVLENWGIEMPCAVAEINLDFLLE